MADYSSIKLDKSRPFGQVIPPEDGAHFEQEGFFFGPDGVLAEGRWLDDAARAKADKILARRAASIAAEKARREALEKAGFSGDDIEREVRAESEPAQGGADAGAEEVDLAGWGRGEINVPWFKLKKAFREQQSREVENPRDAVDFLIENGMIAAESARKVS